MLLCVAMKNLLVIVSDRLTDLIRKGEITARYYNPGEFFDDVHILMINDDNPELSAIQKTVGNARLHLHNLPVPPFKSTLGWHPALLRSWINAGVKLAEKIKPDLIRTYGIFHNGFLAARIKKALDIPLAVSLHTHPDFDMRRTVPPREIKKRIMYECYRHLERESLCSADQVIIVYESQREYVIKNGARSVSLIYNVINSSAIQQKKCYDTSSPPQIISVGRQFKEKNPENIIRAMTHLDAVLTVVGDGAYHEYLIKLTDRLGLKERIVFRKAMSNDEICVSLPGYDIFAVHCDYVGIPKAVIEPLLVGLPVVINRNPVASVPEIEGDWVLSVENTEPGYASALEKLIKDKAMRELLGGRAIAYAEKNFLPHMMEQKMSALYQQLLAA